MISGVSPETRRSRKFDTANQGDLKMPLYSNAIRDERVRDYLPVRRDRCPGIRRSGTLPGGDNLVMKSVSVCGATVFQLMSVTMKAGVYEMV